MNAACSIYSPRDLLALARSEAKRQGGRYKSHAIRVIGGDGASRVALLVRMDGRKGFEVVSVLI